MPRHPVDEIQVGSYYDLVKGSNGDTHYTIHHIPSTAATARAILIDLYNEGIDLGPKINQAFSDARKYQNINYLKNIGGESHQRSLPPHIKQILREAHLQSPAIRIPHTMNIHLTTSRADNPFLHDMQHLWQAAERDIQEVAQQLKRQFQGDAYAHKKIHGMMPALVGELQEFQRGTNSRLQWVISHPSTRKRPADVERGHAQKPYPNSPAAAVDQGTIDTSFQVYLASMMRRLSKYLPVVGAGVIIEGLAETRDHLNDMRAQVAQLNQGVATPGQIAELNRVIHRYQMAAAAQFGISIVPGLGGAAGDMALTGSIQSLQQTFDQLKQKILNDPKALEKAAIINAAKHVAHEAQQVGGFRPMAYDTSSAMDTAGTESGFQTMGYSPGGRRWSPAEFERAVQYIRAKYYSGDRDVIAVVEGHKQFIADNILVLGSVIRDLEMIQQRQVYRVSGLQVQDVPAAQTAAFISNIPCPPSVGHCIA